MKITRIAFAGILGLASTMRGGYWEEGFRSEHEVYYGAAVYLRIADANSGEIYGEMHHIEGLPKGFHWATNQQTEFYPVGDSWDDLNMISSVAICDLDRGWDRMEFGSLDGYAIDASDEYGYCDATFISS